MCPHPTPILRELPVSCHGDCIMLALSNLFTPQLGEASQWRFNSSVRVKCFRDEPCPMQGGDLDGGHDS